jgi:hypothetical protein
MASTPSGKMELKVGSGGLFGNIGRGARRLATGVARGEPNSKNAESARQAGTPPAPSGAQRDRPSKKPATPTSGNSQARRKRSLLNANAVSRQGNSVLG